MISCKACTVPEAPTQICQPLKEFLNISNFSLRRLYADGSRFYLCSNPIWVEHYFNMDYWSMGNFKQLTNAHKLHYILWDHWPKDDDSFLVVLRDSQENFNQAHGLSFIESNKNFLDVYSFATIKDNEKINNLYLNNLEPLEKFINYFCIEALPFIKDAEATKLNISINEDKTLLLSTPEISPYLNTEKFYSDIQCNKLSIKMDQKNIWLSKREAECLIYNIKGKTSKEIARILSISHRTVEYYLYKLKQKSMCGSRSELIENFLSSKAARDFIFDKNLD